MKVTINQHAAKFMDRKEEVTFEEVFVDGVNDGVKIDIGNGNSIVVRKTDLERVITSLSS